MHFGVGDEVVAESESTERRARRGVVEEVRRVEPPALSDPVYMVGRRVHPSAGGAKAASQTTA